MKGGHLSKRKLTRREYGYFSQKSYRISTQDIERFNLTMRMLLARLQRKTIKFSFC